eukprot:TRINITY_DN9981_c0_g1_i1.p1 TRINITY_DN9981_c0_g1~~TRINITY_DN9981_c0_g1_i1.p1  ORF type:complete len:100 (-),score=25.13 TRINITY_DN9981_c0_g1_i1:89-388(-)
MFLLLTRLQDSFWFLFFSFFQQLVNDSLEVKWCNFEMVVHLASVICDGNIAAFKLVAFVILDGAISSINRNDIWEDGNEWFSKDVTDCKKKTMDSIDMV